MLMREVMDKLSLLQHGCFERGQVNSSRQLAGREVTHVFTVNFQCIFLAAESAHLQRLLIEHLNKIGTVKGEQNQRVFKIDRKWESIIHLCPAQAAPCLKACHAGILSPTDTRLGCIDLNRSHYRRGIPTL